MNTVTELAACCVAALAAIGATAQHHTAAHGMLFGRLNDAAGAAIADADVTFHARLEPALSCLRGWPNVIPPAAAPDAGQTTAGHFSLVAPVDSRSVGLHGVVFARNRTHGAMIPVSALPARIECQPLGRLELPADVHARVQFVSEVGEGIDLGHFDARSVALPAGDYRLLLRRDRSLWTQRVVITAGASVRAEAPSGEWSRVSTSVRSTRQAFVSGWPQAPLTFSSEQHLLLPRDGDPFELLLRNHDGTTYTIDRVWISPHTDRILDEAVAQQSTTRVHDEQGKPIQGARVALVRSNFGQRWTCISIGAANAAGEAGYTRRDDPREAWLVAECPGYGSVAAEPGVDSIRMPVEARLHGRIVGSDGEPLDWANVELRSVASPVLSWNVRTNAIGNFRCAGLPPGTIEIRILDPRAVPTPTLQRVSPGSNRCRVIASAGASLRGRVLSRGGQPAEGAVITVSTVDGPPAPARTAVSNELGLFSLEGLPPDAVLRVSARLVSGSKTYITSRHRAQPGDEVTLELFSEDPEPPWARRAAK